MKSLPRTSNRRVHHAVDLSVPTVNRVARGQKGEKDWFDWLSALHTEATDRDRARHQLVVEHLIAQMQEDKVQLGDPSVTASDICRSDGQKIPLTHVKGINLNTRGVYAAQVTDNLGKRHTKYFSPKNFCSSEAARVSAYRWRIEMELFKEHSDSKRQASLKGERFMGKDALTTADSNRNRLKYKWERGIDQMSAEELEEMRRDFVSVNRLQSEIKRLTDSNEKLRSHVRSASFSLSEAKWVLQCLVQDRIHHPLTFHKEMSGKILGYRSEFRRSTKPVRAIGGRRRRQRRLPEGAS